jgi:hypothetical protein
MKLFTLLICLVISNTHALTTLTDQAPDNEIKAEPLNANFIELRDGFINHGTTVKGWDANELTSLSLGPDASALINFLNDGTHEILETELNINFNYLKNLSDKVKDYADCRESNANIFGYDLTNTQGTKISGTNSPDNCVLDCLTNYTQVGKECILSSSTHTITLINNGTDLDNGEIVQWTNLQYSTDSTDLTNALTNVVDNCNGQILGATQSCTIELTYNPQILTLDPSTNYTGVPVTELNNNYSISAEQIRNCIVNDLNDTTGVLTVSGLYNITNVDNSACSIDTCDTGAGYEYNSSTQLCESSYKEITITLNNDDAEGYNWNNIYINSETNLLSSGVEMVSSSCASAIVNPTYVTIPTISNGVSCNVVFKYLKNDPVAQSSFGELYDQIVSSNDNFPYDGGDYSYSITRNNESRLCQVSDIDSNNGDSSYATSAQGSVLRTGNDPSYIYDYSQCYVNTCDTNFSPAVDGLSCEGAACTTNIDLYNNLGITNFEGILSIGGDYGNGCTYTCDTTDSYEVNTTDPTIACNDLTRTIFSDQALSISNDGTIWTVENFNNTGYFIMTTTGSTFQNVLYKMTSSFPLSQHATVSYSPITLATGVQYMRTGLKSYNGNLYSIGNSSGIDYLVKINSSDIMTKINTINYTQNFSARNAKTLIPTGHGLYVGLLESSNNSYYFYKYDNSSNLVEVTNTANIRLQTLGNYIEFDNSLIVASSHLISGAKGLFTINNGTIIEKTLPLSDMTFRQFIINNNELYAFMTSTSTGFVILKYVNSEWTNISYNVLDGATLSGIPEAISYGNEIYFTATSSLTGYTHLYKMDSSGNISTLSTQEHKFTDLVLMNDNLFFVKQPLYNGTISVQKYINLYTVDLSTPFDSSTWSSSVKLVSNITNSNDEIFSLKENHRIINNNLFFVGKPNAQGRQLHSLSLDGRSSTLGANNAYVQAISGVSTLIQMWDSFNPSVINNTTFYKDANGQVYFIEL